MYAGDESCGDDVTSGYDYHDMFDNAGRDFAEESYWRDYCSGCDCSPCGGDCDGAE